MTLVPRLRALALWLAATAAALAVVVAVGADAVALRGGTRGSDLEALLVRLCSLALVCCAAWLWVVTTVVLCEVVRRPTPLADRRLPGIPHAVRRCLLGLCGLALTGGLAGLAVPAGAAEGTTVLDGLPLPDRAEGVGPVTAAPYRPHVTVRPGDSLWQIASRDLGPDAGDGAVGRHVLELHALNRAVIGPDPNVVHPGQRLRLPSGSSLTKEPR